jgi:MoaA/NifB/PqqE/SkfB family radical SAM enzyme
MIQTTWRRRSWLFRRLGARKIWNLAVATKDFALKRETTRAMPAMVKIDISPVCNLRCTVCVHADAGASELLARQDFAPSQRMTREQFQKIVDQLRGRTTAVSLYTWGDPLTHPDLDALCRIAADAGLQVHISTNFSFKLSDERIRSIVESGLSHLTVCVDGLSQENYEKTRVGGNVERVLHNLERLCRVRRELGRREPLVEVQFIKFQHNVHELEEARRLVLGYGVDEFASFWGALHNYADREPENYEVVAPKKVGAVPGCFWPHYSMVVKWNGDVIPCCEHRMAAQHAPGGDARTFGNVFETDLREIWNARDYRQARRLVSDPSRSEREPELKKHFCDGCFVIFDTTIRDTARWADQHAWEEVHRRDERGKVVRRPRSETGLPF